jgi:hypothetical protein
VAHIDLITDIASEPDVLTVAELAVLVDKVNRRMAGYIDERPIDDL